MRVAITTYSITIIIITSLLFGFHGVALSQSPVSAQSESPLEELCYTSRVQSSYKRVSLTHRLVERNSIGQFTTDLTPQLIHCNGSSAKVFEDLFIKHCSFLI